jgi:hypothetical protein
VHTYRSISHANITSGESVLFWKDYWKGNTLLCDVFPRLFSYSINEDDSVAHLIRVDDIFDHFATPISVEAHEELMQIQQLIQDISLVDGEGDPRSFVWGSSYTLAKFYSFLFEAVPCEKVLQAIWTSKCLPKLQVFAWLLFLDRLNTKDIMHEQEAMGGSGWPLLCFMQHELVRENKPPFLPMPICHSMLESDWCHLGSFPESL